MEKTLEVKEERFSCFLPRISFFSREHFFFKLVFIRLYAKDTPSISRAVLSTFLFLLLDGFIPYILPVSMCLCQTVFLFFLPGSFPQVLS